MARVPAMMPRPVTSIEFATRKAYSGMYVMYVRTHAWPEGSSRPWFFNFLPPRTHQISVRDHDAIYAGPSPMPRESDIATPPPPSTVSSEL